MRWHLVVGLYLLGGGLCLQAWAAAHPESIPQVNTLVAGIDKKVEAHELSFLHIDYDLRMPAEGVPPSFKFFFDDQDATLVACQVHVGHETWGKTFTYYFDSDGVPLKYREDVSGREDHPGPSAIIYGPKGDVVWKNIGSPRIDPKEILNLYKEVRARLDSYSMP